MKHRPAGEDAGVGLVPALGAAVLDSRGDMLRGRTNRTAADSSRATLPVTNATIAALAGVVVLRSRR